MKHINWKKRRRLEDRMTIFQAVLCLALLLFSIITIVGPLLPYVINPRPPTW